MKMKSACSCKMKFPISFERISSSEADIKPWALSQRHAPTACGMETRSTGFACGNESKFKTDFWAQAPTPFNNTLQHTHINTNLRNASPESGCSEDDPMAVGRHLTRSGNKITNELLNYSFRQCSPWSHPKRILNCRTHNTNYVCSV